jgi:hypothetical protein
MGSERVPSFGEIFKETMVAPFGLLSRKYAALLSWCLTPRATTETTWGIRR